MSTIYYRRWTRMHIHPAAKYFKKFNVIDPGFQNFWHLSNQQNRFPQNKGFMKRQFVDHEQQINTKLINNLFLKYPDLKYESINRQKYHGDNFNSYSYSFAFITEQKKLMKNGYTMKKAFQIVQQKFQDKMKRKIDQTLISKGLAIGNRARSLLTIYQQQVEHESKMKMLRTKREVEKYQEQLKEIDEAIKRPVGNQELENESQHYQRIFSKITKLSNEQINNQFKDQKRSQLIKRVQTQFQNMFSQFYQTAATRDRLNGLTDDQIKQNIMSSPNKIKRLTKQIVKYLKNKGDISINTSGVIQMNDSINQKLKKFIYTSPTIKIAILNHLLGYESPRFSYQKKLQAEAKSRLKQFGNIKTQQIKKQVKDTIKQNKIKDLELVVEKKIPEDSRVYRLLQSSQQRMLRLQIKYLQSFIKQTDKPEQSLFTRLKQVIQQFRRLKFRMQKRHKNIAEGELVFPEHFAFGEKPNTIEDINMQYEDLVEYLRRKTQERRLKAIDQVDDNKISTMIKKQALDQTPSSQGQQHKHN